MQNGLSASELFSQPSGWTFDDVNVLPAYNAGVLKERLGLQSKIGSIALNLPLVSSPMDTVTEAPTAREMALQGGLGIIHMNLSIDAAVREVQLVKRYQMGIVSEPICRAPSDALTEVEKVRQEFGFSTLLITEDGTTRTKLLGMITKGHVGLRSDHSLPLGEAMIPVEQLMTVPAEQITSWGQALTFLMKNPVAHKLPLLRPDGSVAGFITRKDVEKMAGCPHALVNKDTSQLRVGAAVSTHEQDDERVAALIKTGVDVIVIDSAQGSTIHAVRRIKQIRCCSGDVVIIAGNVVTPQQAEPLIKAGAQSLRVGMGSGSICTTQNVIGVGRAQLSAIYDVSCAPICRDNAVSVIADGGVRSSGDIVKALACGASAIMVGRLIAGCDETPARAETYHGGNYKRYRGMGSEPALRLGGALRYGRTVNTDRVVAQGTEGLVPIEGPLSALLIKLKSAVQTGLEYLGCDSIERLHKKVEDGEIRFELRSQAARLEGLPHSIQEG